MSRSREVHGIGPSPAKLMFVGEGPGRDEEREGKPFVGSAGQVLTKACLAAGINRDNVFITNITRVRPPKEKDEFFIENGAPTQEFIEGIKATIEDIKRVKPTVIVALGNWALFGLTGSTGITKYRGSILPCQFDSSIKVVAALHPSFIQRGMWNKMPLLIWDLARAKEESEIEGWDHLPRKLNTIIDPPVEELDKYMDLLLAGDHITYDTEWYNPGEIACIGFSNSPDWQLVISDQYPDHIEIYRDLLDNEIDKIAQNAMFDVPILHRTGIRVGGKHFDTMIAWHSCWTDLGEKGLDTLCSVLTKVPYYKDEIRIWGRTGNLNTLLGYNGKDIYVTEESARKIKTEEFKHTGGDRGYEISMSIFDTFVRATNFGILADRDRLRALRKMHLERAETLEHEIWKQIGWEVNFRSPQQVARLVYDELGVKGTTRSTAQKPLMEIAATTKDPLVKAIMTATVRVREDRNLVSRYYDESSIDRDGRWRCSWNLAGTRNGRLATNKTWWGSGLPLQTVPDEARSMFIADDDCLFVGWDLEQAEARLVAYLTHDEDLIEDMESGTDIHRKLASRLPFGKTYEQLLAMPKDCRERHLAKICRHALNYQMGPLTFKETVNKDYIDSGISITASEAKLLRERYLAIHHTLPQWWRDVEAELSRNGSLINPLGRRRRFFGQWGGELFRDATAYVPQSTVGDLTTIGIARTDDLLGHGGAGWAIPLIHMHDGGLIQVPADRAEDAAAEVKEIMSIPIKIAGYPDVVIPVEVFIGKNWGYYSKENPDGLKKVA